MVPLCSRVVYSAGTLEWHAAGTRHDTPTSRNIQAQGRPVVVLSLMLNAKLDTTTT